MMLVITYTEKNKKTGQKELLVSHGIDLDNDDKVVILPQVPPGTLGAKWDPSIGEFILI